MTESFRSPAGDVGLASVYGAIGDEGGGGIENESVPAPFPGFPSFTILGPDQDPAGFDSDLKRGVFGAFGSDEMN
jgi:hypothetical protein